MRAVFFGTYDRSHSANRLLRTALADSGFAVTEVHEALWEETREKGAGYFSPASLLGLGARYAGLALRLARRWRATAPADDPPLVVVGFGGQLDVLLAARVCHPRRGLVFAPLVSLTETLVEDRAVFPAGGLRARLVTALDRATWRRADLVLADTAAHADYLVELGAARARVAAWHLGAEPEFWAVPGATVEPRRVLFVGRCVPLHGLGTIVEAAARLGDRAALVVIGRGPERGHAEARARELGVDVEWRDEIPLASLPAELARAAVVLGVFGAGRKAAMVVPNKVYQAVAAGRPLVTREGPALREVLTPGEHCLACPPADPAALAAAIGRLLDDPPAAARMGAAARAHLARERGPARLAAALAATLEERFGPRALAPSHALARG
jgi:glycosyltransferase involved in cell wall biosynthesis